jgi:hypothetical protein
MRPALSTPRGSKLSRTRFVNAAIAAGSGSKTSAVARTAARRAGEGSRGRLNDGPIFPDLARPALWATSQRAEAEDVKVAFPLRASQRRLVE